MPEVVQTMENPCMGKMPWQCRALLTEAVLASFSLQSAGNTLPERIPTKKIYDAFYELRANYPAWLDYLSFEEKAGSRISKQLESVLFILGAFGLATVENRDYTYLSIDSDVRNAIKQEIERKTQGQKLDVLRQLSNDFAGLVR